MAITFPTNPNLNETYTSGGITWIWTGTTWDLVPIASPSFTNVSANSVTATTINGTTLIGSLTGNVTGNVTGNLLNGSVTNISSLSFSTGQTVNSISNDGTFSANSDSLIPTQKAVKTLVNSSAGAANALTGTTLANNVVNSSLTSVGTLISLNVTGSVTASSFNGALSGAANITTLSVSSTVSGTGITNLFASPPVIGGILPAAGTFSNLSATISATLSPSGTVTINPTTSGSINNVTVGATTPLSGRFTTLSSTNTTDATNFASAAVTIAGGLGVAKKIISAGDVSITSSTASSGPSTGALQVTGGAWIGQNLYVTGTLVAGTLSYGGGAIDNTPIGAVTPNTGAFTILTATTGNFTNLNIASTSVNNYVTARAVAYAVALS